MENDKEQTDTRISGGAGRALVVPCFCRCRLLQPARLGTDSQGRCTCPREAMASTAPLGPTVPTAPTGPDGLDGRDATNAFLLSAEIPTSLSISVSSVTLAAQSQVNFRVTDPAGRGAVGLLAGSSGQLRFGIAKFVPGTNGERDAWQSYINSKATAGSTSKTAATTERTGTLVDHQDGSYTYTFAADLTQATDPMTSAAISLEPTLTLFFPRLPWSPPMSVVFSFSYTRFYQISMYIAISQSPSASSTPWTLAGGIVDSHDLECDRFQQPQRSPNRRSARFRSVFLALMTD